MCSVRWCFDLRPHPQSVVKGFASTAAPHPLQPHSAAAFRGQGFLLENLSFLIDTPPFRLSRFASEFCHSTFFLGAVVRYVIAQATSPGSLEARQGYHRSSCGKQSSRRENIVAMFASRYGTGLVFLANAVTPISLHGLRATVWGEGGAVVFSK